MSEFVSKDFQELSAQFTDEEKNNAYMFEGRCVDHDSESKLNRF